MSVVYLSQRETQVFDLLQSGCLAHEIADKLGFKNSSVYGIISRLIDLGMVDRRKEGKHIHYHVLLSRYVMIPDEQELFKIRRALIDSGEPFQTVKLTPSMRQTLESLYENKTRTELASALGVPRYVVNRELIRMGLERKE